MRSTEVREISRDLLQSVVNWADGQAASEYACLGPAELRTALQRAPAGHRTRIAEAAYAAGIEPEHALRTLMEQAVGDGSAEHGALDHPLRIVRDYLAHPDTKLEARRLAVETADAWLSDDRDAEVGLRVLMHAVQPGVSSRDFDPIGETVTAREGAVPRSWIGELSLLWDSILAVVEREQVPITAPLLNALHPWVHPSAIGFGSGPDDETKAAIRAVAVHVIQTLAVIFADRPGVLRRLREYVKSSDVPVRIKVPDDFAALFPEPRDGPDIDGDIRDWELRADGQCQSPRGEAAGAFRR